MQSKFLIFKNKKKKTHNTHAQHKKRKLGEILKCDPEKVDGFKWQILMPKEKFKLWKKESF